MRYVLSIAGIILLALSAPAFSQKAQVQFQNSNGGIQPVTPLAPLPTTATTSPKTVTTTPTNGTIAITSTFQSVLAASTTRTGCTIQNQGSNVMYVFFGVNASATTASSLQIQPGQPIGCAAGGIVLTDNVSLTGTAGDAFVVNAQ